MTSPSKIKSAYGLVEFIHVPVADEAGTEEIPVVPIYASDEPNLRILCAALLHAVRRIDALEAALSRCGQVGQ